MAKPTTYLSFQQLTSCTTNIFSTCTIDIFIVPAGFLACHGYRPSTTSSTTTSSWCTRCCPGSHYVILDFVYMLRVVFRSSRNTIAVSIYGCLYAIGNTANACLHQSHTQTACCILRVRLPGPSSLRNSIAKCLAIEECPIER